jgi:fumarate reductase subunit D
MIKNVLNKIAVAATVFAMPLLASADLVDSINTITGLLNKIIPILMIIATIIFLWGVIQYITAGGEEEKIKTGRNYMIFGLIALFVMVAVWGIVNILVSTFVSGESTAIPGEPGAI